MSNQLRLATRQLACAEDAQLAQVVALIDQMRERGEADVLIAPLRRRLKRLRLPRPPRFGRILFAPLNPVIVPPNVWKPGMASVPRSALAPLEAQLRSALGARLEPLEATIASSASAGAEARTDVGSLLWPLAAAALHDIAKSKPPDSWLQNGLPSEFFGQLCAAIALVLERGFTIENWAALEGIGQSVPREEIELALRPAIDAGEFAAALLAAVIMSRVPTMVAIVLRALSAVSPRVILGSAPGATLALDAAAQHLSLIALQDVPRAQLADASRYVARGATLLEAMLREAGPRRREELDEIARSFQQQCHLRFTDSLAAEVVAPAYGLSREDAASGVPELENAARDLRRFELAARSVGGASSYDAMLERAAEAIRDMPEGSALTNVDRLRLTEILVGSEKAMQLLKWRN